MSEPVFPDYFTDSLLRRKAGMTLYDRGRDVFRSNAVLQMALLDRKLFAQVAGTADQPYRIDIEFGDGSIEASDCDCPYGGPWCKHIVAAGLAALNTPDQVTRIPALEPQLQALTKAELIALILKQVQHQPELALNLQPQLDRLRLLAEPEPTETEDVHSLNQLRAHTRKLLSARSRQPRSRHVMYQVDPALMAMSDLLDEIQIHLDQNHILSALAMLEELSEAVIPAFEASQEWYSDDDDDIDQIELLDLLGEQWTQTLLRLPPDQLSQSLHEQLKSWHSQLEDFCRGDVLQEALTVFDADQALFAAALRGEVSPERWLLEAGDIEQQLVLARLQQLQQRGEWQELLNLAQIGSYPEMTAQAMIALGQAEAAVDFISAQLDPDINTATLCTQLEAHGHPELALELAEQALNQKLHHPTLPGWAADAARRHDNRPLLMTATWQLAISEASQVLYHKLKHLHGPAWINESERFVSELLAAYPAFKEDMVEILLAEGHHQEVMEFVRTTPYDSENVRIAITGLIEHEPDWCITMACLQAEQIMNASKSAAYFHVPEWLDLARQAWQQIGQDKQWQAYLEALIKQHRRKNALRPRLESLK